MRSAEVATSLRISHKNKFVFIAINKTGSSTMRHLLNKHSDIFSEIGQGAFAHHTTSQKLKDVFTKNNWNWDDYLSFTVVRHPISRIYSIYKYRLRVASNPHMKKKHAIYFYKSCIRFKDLNLTFDAAVLSNKVSIPPQTDWILSSDRSMSLLDKIIKIEHIADELPGIWNQLELPLQEISSIPKINASPSEKSWESLLSVEAIDKLKNIYKEDFELLNY
ncbi:sulfotransferase family protein [Synechococcus sp. AH-601-B19]|nr:sulfotransferase family protein [Synechococcus sp. AH-601-B19]